mmetsp:Transcript_43257/g.122518  ORF Transcript_43257/g.122518 Transcript_43257/m.122518 type:complete len:267 (-) Transcript_43257:567-1367(-)
MLYEPTQAVAEAVTGHPEGGADRTATAVAMVVDQMSEDSEKRARAAYSADGNGFDRPDQPNVAQDIRMPTAVARIPSVVQCNVAADAHADAVDALHIHDEALLDSGCSWHVFTSPDFFVHLRPLPPATSQLKVANGAKVAIEGEGEVALRVNLKYNLLSVSALEDEGYNTRMDSRTAAHADRATNNEYTTREAPAAAHAARPQDATYPVCKEKEETNGKSMTGIMNAVSKCRSYFSKQGGMYCGYAAAGISSTDGDTTLWAQRQHE